MKKWRLKYLEKVDCWERPSTEDNKIYILIENECFCRHGLFEIGL